MTCFNGVSMWTAWQHPLEAGEVIVVLRDLPRLRDVAGTWSSASGHIITPEGAKPLTGPGAAD